MYAACFQVSGWAGAQSFLFSGDTLKEVVDGLNGIQDLFFLGLMSRMDGEAAAGELTKLETFTERYQSDILTEEDVANFAVELSIGSIRCVELRSGEDMPGSGVALTALQGSDVQYVPRGMLQISANGWHALLQGTIQEVQIGICGMFFWHSNSSCSIFLYVNYNI